MRGGESVGRVGERSGNGRGGRELRIVGGSREGVIRGLVRWISLVHPSVLHRVASQRQSRLSRSIRPLNSITFLLDQSATKERSDACEDCCRCSLRSQDVVKLNRVDLNSDVCTGGKEREKNLALARLAGASLKVGAETRRGRRACEKR